LAPARSQTRINTGLNGIEAETKRGKKRGRKATVELDTEEEHKASYHSIIDSLVSELNFRFQEENIRPLVVIHNLIMSTHLDQQLNIREELKIYGSEIDFTDLNMNLNVWYEYKKQNPEQFGGTKFRKIADQFMNCNLHEVFKELFILFAIYLAVPISSATGERSFSVLKLLKTYIRNTTDQQRLSDLAVISVNSDLLKNISVDDIINKFASLKSRRLKFCN